MPVASEKTYASKNPNMSVMDKIPSNTLPNTTRLINSINKTLQTP